MRTRITPDKARRTDFGGGRPRSHQRRGAQNRVSPTTRPRRVLARDSAALEHCDASDHWLDTSSAPVERPSGDRPLDRPRRGARAIDGVRTLAKRPWRCSLAQGEGPSAGAQGSLVVHGIAAEVAGGCQPAWLSPPPSDRPHSKGPSTVHSRCDPTGIEAIKRGSVAPTHSERIRCPGRTIPMKSTIAATTGPK